MDYSKLVAVTGLPGLFEMINSKTDGAILRSLEDNSTKFVSSRIHNFSHLESIEIYTVKENVNLVDIFHAMEKESEKFRMKKMRRAVKKYFEKVYADLDFERVYASDLKKMVRWFPVFKKNNIEIKLSPIPEPEEEAVEVEEQVSEEKAPVAKPKPAAKKKSPAATSEKKTMKKRNKKESSAKEKVAERLHKISGIHRSLNLQSDLIQYGIVCQYQEISPQFLHQILSSPTGKAWNHFSRNLNRDLSNRLATLSNG